MPDPTDAKQMVRRRFRSRRREIPDQAERSLRICRLLRTVVDPSRHRTVMLYEAVPGEPDLTTFAEWCRSEGMVVVQPSPHRDADAPASPSDLDVVVVPGLAFTPGGDRLGQGGGWYDRLLPQLADDCVRIGVCFTEQLVEELPIEPHDARLHVVLTDGPPSPAN